MAKTAQEWARSKGGLNGLGGWACAAGVAGCTRVHERHVRVMRVRSSVLPYDFSGFRHQRLMNGLFDSANYVHWDPHRSAQGVT